mgnify:CR=1 FL=1
MNKVTMHGNFTMNVYATATFEGDRLAVEYDENTGWNAGDFYPEDWTDTEVEAFMFWLDSLPAPQIRFIDEDGKTSLEATA